MTGFEVSEIRCLKKLDVRISPIYGETWEYPSVENMNTFTVFIRDRSGEVIFEKIVNVDFDHSWDGTLDNGSVINSGIYFIEIKSVSEELFVGTLTVVQ